MRRRGSIPTGVAACSGSWGARPLSKAEELGFKTREENAHSIEDGNCDGQAGGEALGLAGPASWAQAQRMAGLRFRSANDRGKL